MSWVKKKLRKESEGKEENKKKQDEIKEDKTKQQLKKHNDLTVVLAN